MKKQTPPSPKNNIRWWALGLIGGILSLAITATYLHFMDKIEGYDEFGDNLGGTMLFVLLIAPTLAVIVAQAKWGHDNPLTRKTIATALLSITFPTLGVIYGIFNAFWLIAGNISWGSEETTLLVIALVFTYIPTMVVAWVIWGTVGPGHTAQ